MVRGQQGLLDRSSCALDGALDLARGRTGLLLESLDLRLELTDERLEVVELGGRVAHVDGEGV